MSMIILQKYQKENNSEIYSPISFTPTPKNFNRDISKSRSDDFFLTRCASYG